MFMTLYPKQQSGVLSVLFSGDARLRMHKEDAGGVAAATYLLRAAF